MELTREEHIAIHCGNCGNCVVCNDDVQLASSVRYSADTWLFQEIRPGLFALYGLERKIEYLGNDWNELLKVYRERPAYVPRERIKAVRGIDTSKLRITI
jgi:hypothetical protein